MTLKLRRLPALIVLAALGGLVSPVSGATPDSAAAVIQPYLDKRQLAGAVALVADQNRVLSVESMGFADLAARKPMKNDALFWIASMSKPVTAAALMILVDEGRVNVADPVEKYLPEFKDVWLAAETNASRMVLQRPHRAITVRDILSHTSGLPFKSTLEQPTLDGLPLRDAVRSYAMMPLLFEPGSKYLYSNAGINTAGRIIEVVSGMPYEKFLAERLFQPLGMRDTTFWPSERQQRRLATSYKANAAKDGLEATTVAQLTYPLHDRARQPMPAGGLFSTAADVARFGQLLLNDGVFHGKRILSEAAVKEMTRRQTPASLAQQYGFGIQINPDGSFGHGGAYATKLTIDPARGLVTVWLVQNAGSPPEWKRCEADFQKWAVGQFGRRTP